MGKSVKDLLKTYNNKNKWYLRTFLIFLSVSVLIIVGYFSNESFKKSNEEHQTKVTFLREIANEIYVPENDLLLKISRDLGGTAYASVDIGTDFNIEDETDILYYANGRFKIRVNYFYIPEVNMYLRSVYNVHSEKVYANYVIEPNMLETWMKFDSLQKEYSLYYENHNKSNEDLKNEIWALKAKNPILNN